MVVDAELSHTDWGLIRDAAQADELLAQDALEQVARRYWPAIYAFIRRSGRGVHQAADLTQGFICDVVIQRGLLLEADPQRGRFRCLLLSALQNYLREQHRHAHRVKRGGAVPAEPSGYRVADAESSLVQAGHEDTPERAFALQWTAMLIQRVMDEVRQQCVADKLAAHWTLFEHRIARPMLLGEDPADYPSLMARLNVKTTAQAANMLITVKRRFARALVREVSRTLESRADVDDELRLLLRDVEVTR